ncbi:unnamed protein product [Prorocentrum cordatum]|uniref:Uncharacterized protein n=1 Tax=Prorocentrum cordatum TaxID=2364126 RepID=A0ABN9UB09_9DINO|nr:unnamed protein product [Polarella glacialis]
MRARPTLEGLVEGSRLPVLHHGDDCYHERLLSQPVIRSAGHWVAATPDFEVYDEVHSAAPATAGIGGADGTGVLEKAKAVVSRAQRALRSGRELSNDYQAMKERRKSLEERNALKGEKVLSIGTGGRYWPSCRLSWPPSFALFKMGDGPAGGPPRELLPCPPPFPLAKGPEVAAGCRSVRRRAAARQHWQAWCNRGVIALNELFGHPVPAGDDDSTPLSAGQLSCLEELKDACRAVGPPRAGLGDAAGASRELCGARAGYAFEADAAGLPCPYRAGAVSLPPVSSKPVEFSNVLDGRELKMWSDWRSRLLRLLGSSACEAPSGARRVLG